jgi:hypothetical protein
MGRRRRSPLLHSAAVLGARASLPGG